MLLIATLLALAQFEPSYDAYPSYHLDELPAQVWAPPGELSLYADFDAVRDGKIILYLVNRTNQDVVLPWQDGDFYLKLEYRSDDEWARAEKHYSSGCGNSYFNPPILAPGKFITVKRQFLEEGQHALVRYRHHVGERRLVSNAGTGFYNPQDAFFARYDDLAPDDQCLQLVVALAQGSLIAPVPDQWEARRLAMVRLFSQCSNKKTARQALISLSEKNEEHWSEMAARFLMILNAVCTEETTE